MCGALEISISLHGVPRYRDGVLSWLVYNRADPIPVIPIYHVPSPLPSLPIGMAQPGQCPATVSQEEWTVSKLGHIYPASTARASPPTQQTWDIEQLLGQCLADVVGGGLTLNRHWFNVSCLLGIWLLSQLQWLAQRWHSHGPAPAGAGPSSNQFRPVSPVKWLSFIKFITVQKGNSFRGNGHHADMAMSPVAMHTTWSTYCTPRPGRRRIIPNMETYFRWKFFCQHDDENCCHD